MLFLAAAITLRDSINRSFHLYLKEMEGLEYQRIEVRMNRVNISLLDTFRDVFDGALILRKNEEFYKVPKDHEWCVRERLEKCRLNLTNALLKIGRDST